MMTLRKLQYTNGYYGNLYFFSTGATAPSGPGHPHYRGFTITLRYTTLGRTPLDEWSARRRHVCLTTHSTHKRQTSMTTVGFEPAISRSERPQKHALDSAATGMGGNVYIGRLNLVELADYRNGPPCGKADQGSSWGAFCFRTPGTSCVANQPTSETRMVTFVWKIGASSSKSLSTKMEFSALL
jgi:hypothetical protein